MYIGEIIFEHTMPTLAIWLGVVMAFLIVAYSFWRYITLDKMTITLVAVRVLFFACLAWCLFLPGRRRSLTHMLKPRFVVAVDTSKSMTLTPADGVPARWSVVQQVLAEDWVTAVSSECDIDAYTFATEVGPRMDLEDAVDLAADRPATLLRDSLRKLTDRYKGQNVTGFLLLTDGIDTREVYDDWAGEAWPWPIYTVRLEPDAVWEVEPDIRVDTVNTPRRVSVGWSTELKAVISGQGTKGDAINVQLTRDGGLIQESPIKIPSEGGAREVVLQLEHPKIGVYTYRIIAPPMEGESNTNDNSYAVSVQVIDAKNRLLYVEGQPRWESKYLTRALKTNAQITPLCFIRGPNDRFLTIGIRGSMTTDMTESQLAFFKIVVVGNLTAEELGPERAANLLKFTDTGGSLVLLGGTKAWGAEGFLKTPLKKLLPVKSLGSAPVEGKYAVSLMDTGQSHPAFAGDPSLWEGIPPVLSIFPNIALSAAAEALVGARTAKGVEPIVVAQRYGQGKVVAVFTDSLWRWQLSPNAAEKRTYQRFWNQLLAWLSPAEKELAPHQLDLFADREQLFLGEELELSARLGASKEGEERKTGAVSCEITMPDKRKMPFAMGKQHVVTPSGKSFPGFAAKFKAIMPGLHMAVARSRVDGKDIMSDPASFFVKPFTPESVPRPANIELLKTLAGKSRGRYFDDVASLTDALCALEFTSTEEESVKYSSLWENVPIISCLLFLLALDWTIRKLKNMP